MRKKLREIMDKEEGFTLVELLAVIAILAIIVAIAVPAIGNVISDSKGKAEAAETELVKDAARIYFTTEKDSPATGEVKVETLVEQGYLELKNNPINDYKGKSVHKTEQKYEIKSTSGTEQ